MITLCYDLMGARQPEERQTYNEAEAKQADNITEEFTFQLWQNPTSCANSIMCLRIRPHFTSFVVHHTLFYFPFFHIQLQVIVIAPCDQALSQSLHISDGSAHAWMYTAKFTGAWSSKAIFPFPFCLSFPQWFSFAELFTEPFSLVHVDAASTVFLSSLALPALSCRLHQVWFHAHYHRVSVWRFTTKCD